MNSKKILINTIAIYIKILFNTIVTLIATKIVLNSLGENDFGLYNLLAGVITMLSFMNGALMISTQRYMSIAIGERNCSKLKSIFNTSLSIHGILAIVVLSVLLVLQPILINVVLNIPKDSIYTAHIVYDIMVLSSVFTLLQVPYSAAMNAHEDIYYWAFTEAVNNALKLVSALGLVYIISDKLVYYTLFIFSSLAISTLFKYIWCKIKYQETKISISEMKNKVLIKEMFGFVGWNTFGVVGTRVIDQGVSVILNIFFGTIANAAYGIAYQVNGLVLTLSSSITAVFAPSIMQAHGVGDDRKMMKIAIFSSKTTFLISSVTAIPLITFMPEILNIWLCDYPAYSVEFCRLMIYSFVITQLTSGLNKVIYAVGKLKWYQITLFVILVSILPVSYILYKIDFPVNTIFYILLIAQVMTMITNVYYSRRYVSFNVKEFLHRSIGLAIILFLTFVCIGNLLAEDGMSIWKIVLYSIGLCMIYVCLYIGVVYDCYEQKKIFNVLRRNKNEKIT